MFSKILNLLVCESIIVLVFAVIASILFGVVSISQAIPLVVIAVVAHVLVHLTRE